MNGDVRGRVAVISGSASGIGRALAERATARGARVYGLDTRASSEGSGIRELEVDVTDPRAVADALDRIVDEAGGIDVVFNNAGVRSAPVAFLDIDVDRWRSDVDVNLTGAFILAQAAARRMLDHGGVIVNTVSQLAYSVVPESAAYLASKAGLAHLTAAMSRELGPLGIRVLGVAPGIVETEMTRSLMARTEWRRERLSRIPAGRFARPAEIAEFMLDLSARGADYVHGTTVVVDGGYLAGS